jgi:hypothetical protein
MPAFLAAAAVSQLLRDAARRVNQEVISAWQENRPAMAVSARLHGSAEGATCWP